MDRNDLYDAEDFETFWQRYQRMHADPRTRAAHAVATGSAIALTAYGLWKRKRKWIFLAPLADYAIAQSNHRLIEKNRTTPLRRPLWHVRAELRLFRGTCAHAVRRIARR